MTPDEALDLLDRVYKSPAVPVVRAEVERLRQDLAAKDATLGEMTGLARKAEADLAAARAMLIELRDEWVDPSFHMAPHLIACIDAALAGKKK